MFDKILFRVRNKQRKVFQVVFFGDLILENCAKWIQWIFDGVTFFFFHFYYTHFDCVYAYFIFAFTFFSDTKIQSGDIAKQRQQKRDTKKNKLSLIKRFAAYRKWSEKKTSKNIYEIWRMRKDEIATKKLMSILAREKERGDTEAKKSEVQCNFVNE